MSELDLVIWDLTGIAVVRVTTTQVRLALATPHSTHPYSPSLLPPVQSCILPHKEIIKDHMTSIFLMSLNIGI